MPSYIFRCPACGQKVEKQIPMADVSDATGWPWHCNMRSVRVYVPINFSICWDNLTYIDRAERGEETIPGYTNAEVKSTIASMSKMGNRPVKRH